MPNEMTWREAIEKVLSETTGAVHYREITDRIFAKGLRSSIGATPAASVSAELTTAIRDEGDKCPFQKVGRGLYIWKDNTGNIQPPLPTGESEEESETEEQYEIISSFGMFWRRDAINWASTPKILGMQQLGAEPVDFCKQFGIYLLYDGREVIYVGRCTDRALGRRLFEHTYDRLMSRWDRFSWFGLLPVSPEGTLGELPKIYDGTAIIPAIEAIMIEALEPRQNRKRGDDLSAVEYIQKEDPEIKMSKMKQTMISAIGKL